MHPVEDSRVEGCGSEALRTEVAAVVDPLQRYRCGTAAHPLDLEQIKKGIVGDGRSLQEDRDRFRSSKVGRRVGRVPRYRAGDKVRIGDQIDLVRIDVEALPSNARLFGECRAVHWQKRSPQLP